MLSENEILKLYNDEVEFLTQQDELDEPQDIDVYEQAVFRYELLHQILEIPSEPTWCS